MESNRTHYVKSKNRDEGFSVYLWSVTQHITILCFFALLPPFPYKISWTNSIMRYSCLQPSVRCWTQFTRAICRKELDSRRPALSVSSNCDRLQFSAVGFQEAKAFSLFETSVAGKCN